MSNTDGSTIARKAKTVREPQARPPKSKTKQDAETVSATFSIADLDPDYRPSEDEPFMNPRQKAYFRKKLLDWQDDIIRQTRQTIEELNSDSLQHADLTDRASSETDRAMELRARDRQRKLINKINQALKRLDNDEYGYCEETGEPIGVRRLEARPIATLSIEAQERHERREKVYRDD